MPILRTVPQNDKIDFSAGDTKTMKIVRNNFIRAIICRLEVKVVNGGVAPTNHEDNPMSIVKRLRLIKNGKENIFDVPLALRWYEEKYLKGTAPEQTTTSVTASATSTGIATVTIDFAVDENNIEDITALLPAHELTDLQLEADWGVVGTDLQTANAGTITAANTFIKVSLIEVTLTQEDIDKLKAQFGEAKVLSKIVRTITHSVTATNDNFTFQKNLTVGNLIQRHLVKVRDNGARDDALVTRIRFKQYSPVLTDLEDRLYPQSQAVDKVKYKLEAVTKGITIFDWSDKGFLDLTDLKEGDVKYEHNNGAQTGTSDITLVSTEFG